METDGGRQPHRAGRSGGFEPCVLHEYCRKGTAARLADDEVDRQPPVRGAAGGVREGRSSRTSRGFAIHTLGVAGPP